MVWTQEALAAVEARNALVMANTGWAYEFARRHFKKHKTIPLEDLCQVALCGMIRAAERWDPARGKFTTYASWCMRGEIADAIWRYLAIRVPETARPVCAKDRDRALTCKSIQSIEATAGGRWEGEAPTYDVDPGQRIEAADDAEDLRRHMDMLDPKSRTVLEIRYGIDGEKSDKPPRSGGFACTLREAAERLEVTHERVRQIEWEAVGKLRERMGVAI